MIRYLSHNEIDKKKWDTCIHYAVNGNTYAYSWYLDTVCDYWDALVDEDYESVFPLVRNKKAGIHYLYQPPFTQQLGVFSMKQLNPQLINDFLENIPPRFRYIDIQLNYRNKIESEAFEIAPRTTYHLDLIQEYPRLRRTYAENTRRNLKKADKATLQIMPNIEPESLVELFRTTKGKALKVKKRHYYTITRLIYQAVHRNRGETWGVYDGRNNLCAGAFLLKSHHRLTYLFPATGDTGREAGAMPALIDHLIRTNAGHHMTLDFEGSMIPSVARFYKGFGAVPITYWQLKRNLLPWYLRWLKK